MRPHEIRFQLTCEATWRFGRVGAAGANRESPTLDCSNTQNRIHASRDGTYAVANTYHGVAHVRHMMSHMRHGSWRHPTGCHDWITDAIGVGVANIDEGRPRAGGRPNIPPPLLNIPSSPPISPLWLSSTDIGRRLLTPARRGVPSGDTARGAHSRSQKYPGSQHKPTHTHKHAVNVMIGQ
jgi:hypothetical protein